MKRGLEILAHRLKSIRDRVQVVDPSAPAKHIIHWDDETCKDDKGEDQDRCWNHSLR